MNILGISCYYHDAAAVLLKDGKLVAAADEERFTRKKHDASYPQKAIEFVLKTGKLNAKDLDFVVFYEKPFRKLHRILISALSTYPRSLSMFREAMHVWLTKKLWIREEIASNLSLDPSKILFSEHHLSHAASTFYPSPFPEAAILTVDGVGEWTTASISIGKNNKVKIIEELQFPQSLGLLYSAFTAFLGFEVNEGEWKVMGLAPYGKPLYADKIRKIIRFLPDGSFSPDLSYFSFHYSDDTSYTDKFCDLFGDPIPPGGSHLITKKAADLAASIQQITEEILLLMAKNVRKKTGLDNLCLSGGVALNSVANYRIFRLGGFKNIYIQPACGDSGGALGAALYLHHHVLSSKKRQIMAHGYLGAEFSNSNIDNFLKTIPAGENKTSGGATEGFRTKLHLARSQQGALQRKFGIPERQDPSGPPNTSEGPAFNWRKMNENNLIEFISSEISKGKVVGWMEGRAEWGPRALGGRSILADPRNPKMKEIINSKVKFREAFRPFAPSVLTEHAAEVFDLPESYENNFPLRFMLYVIPVKKIWRKIVPAITHADNSARIQLVDRHDNPLYWKLINSFYQKTGVPLLLNTSFNLKGEPIVNSPEDAFSTFERSGIDILVMGNYVCEKTGDL